MLWRRLQQRSGRGGSPGGWAFRLAYGDKSVPMGQLAKDPFTFQQGKVVPDEYDERSYCLYDTDASTVYGVCAFFVLLLAQLLVTGVTRCLCFAVFAVSWCASLKP